MSETEEKYGKDDTWEEDLTRWVAEKVNSIQDGIKILEHYHRGSIIKPSFTLASCIFDRLYELGFLEGSRQVSQNMITWHDPEEGHPEKETFVIVLTFSGLCKWHRGYYMGGNWWNATDHSRLVNVVKWGSFELPEMKA